MRRQAGGHVVDHRGARAGHPVEPAAAAERPAQAAGDRAGHHAHAAGLHDRPLHALRAVQRPDLAHEAAQHPRQDARAHQLQRQDPALGGRGGALGQRDHVARPALTGGGSDRSARARSVRGVIRGVRTGMPPGARPRARPPARCAGEPATRTRRSARSAALAARRDGGRCARRARQVSRAVLAVAVVQRQAAPARRSPRRTPGSRGPGPPAAPASAGPRRRRRARVATRDRRLSAWRRSCGCSTDRGSGARPPRPSGPPPAARRPASARTTGRSGRRARAERSTSIASSCAPPRAQRLRQRRGGEARVTAPLQRRSGQALGAARRRARG